jgi:ATP-dependent Clp protease ATP-binding subunit ClpC
MYVTIPIYEAKNEGIITWTTLSLGRHCFSRSGRNAVKIQRALVADLKKAMAELLPGDLERFQLPRGMQLERLHLELTLRGEKRRQIAGLYPVVLEPRWASKQNRMVIAYHPLRQQEWFPVGEDEPLEAQASLFFQKAWVDLNDEAVAALESNKKDLIKTISFSAETKTLLDLLPKKDRGVWDDLEADPDKKQKPEHSGTLQVLPKIGTNLTLRAVENALPLGVPRSPYREQLQKLLLGEKKRPALVVGPPGSGKSTILNRLVQDRLEADDYEMHRNLDRIHDVWLVSGKRIIAGMSYVGDWEQRCIDLVEDAKRKRIILWVDDIHAFGRIGQTRHSDRNLAEFFRGPLSRGELTIIAECTPEQLQRLEDDAPSFAALFVRIHVQPTTAGETLRMIMHEARQLEQKHRVQFDPFSFRTVLELGGSLFPGAAFPGKALDLLRELAKQADVEQKDERRLEPKHVVGLLSKKTGLPELLLRGEDKLDAADLADKFERHVMGQPVAVEAACDLILRIRAGLTDPLRPYGVYLFTGPTGTGKTELATAIASYLYGDPARLFRLDMSEYGSADAMVRLIGDRFSPEGLFTQHVLDQPFSAVLLDEIEKAHPLVLNLLLQLFDEGRLTDAAGNTADFRHTVIVMTSNLGAKQRAAVGFEGDPESVLFDIARAVKEFFPPELFNRIDRIVPFRPLSKETALKIAEKELSRLVARRGLVDRSIFVDANKSVLERIVREAFDPQDGARPVKRYIESRIGSLLTGEIVKSKAATLRIFRLFDNREGFRLHTDDLEEVEPKSARYALEPLLDESPLELKKHLAGALAFVKRLLESRDVTELADRIQGELEAHNRGATEGSDLLYHLESTRQRLFDLKDKMEFLLDAHKDAPGPVEQGFDGRLARTHVPRLARDEMLECLGELQFLRRALRKVTDPQQHAVFVELLRIGHPRHAGRLRAKDAGAGIGLLESLASIYASREELDTFAMRLDDGRILDGRSAEDLPNADLAQVVLRLVGLCVRDLFEDEDGCHVAESLTLGRELVRVRVLSVDTALSPRKIIEAHLKMRREFERALEDGISPLPQSPDALRPAVRVIRFAEDTPPTVEVEDYRLNYSAKVRVRSLGEILEKLWLLRMSREEAPPMQPRTEAPHGLA